MNRIYIMTVKRMISWLVLKQRKALGLGMPEGQTVALSRSSKVLLKVHLRH